MQPASLMMFWFMALRARHYDYLSLLQLIKLCPEHVVCGSAVADSDIVSHGDGRQGNGYICIIYNVIYKCGGSVTTMTGRLRRRILEQLAQGKQITRILLKAHGAHFKLPTAHV